MTLLYRWQERVKQITYSVVALMLLILSPATLVYADDPEPVTDPPVETTQSTDPAPPTESESSTVIETPPASETLQEPEPTPGPQQPTGADANKYTYNQETGLWENDTYTWDPHTKQAAPKTTPEYSYNPVTGRWDTTEYIYDAPSGAYVPNVVSVATPPAGAKIADDPAAQPASTQSQALNQATSSHSAHPQSNSSVTDNGQSHGIFDLFYNALISNNISSTAHSGDALVAMNTLAGNALSGGASAIANIINLLQSSWSMAADNFSTFVGNLFGDIVGDLFLDPGAISNNDTSAAQHTTVNSSGNAAINNTIELEATSGDATVKQNTQAGSARSGDASVIANLINAIGSSISAQQSFVGMLNIFGNLNGDILLPEDLIDTLLASNAVGTLDTSDISNSEVLANFNNNQSIHNNVDAVAQSGSSTVSNNTSAGSAKTGSANTNVTLLNLTGRQVVGKDALLVFVNVLGRWVGMIVNAPTGATSAALGSGVTENGSLAVNSNNNQAITNHVTAKANSGDATVDSNTSAGDATSGNANAAVNILNISGSNFSLSDWFGVLFINVFGSWTGSFGINTNAGTIPVPSVNQPVTPSTQLTASDVRAYNFVPTDDGSYVLESSDQGVAALEQAQVLSGQSPSASDKTPQHQATIQAPNRDWIVSLIGVVIAASLLGTERVLNARKRA